jgi:hypothetical protein
MILLTYYADNCVIASGTDEEWVLFQNQVGKNREVVARRCLEHSHASLVVVDVGFVLTGDTYL